MAAPPPLTNRCQFISAEINHDFNKKNPRLDEYLDNCWNINTVCQSTDITANQQGNPRRAGANGDDDLVQQIFGQNKEFLKNLTPGIEYPITPLAGPIINLSESLQPQAMLYANIPDQQAQALGSTLYVAHANTNETNPEQIYQIFKYPDENFLIIDAVPNFVTSILKLLRFPTVVDYQTGLAFGSLPGHGVSNGVTNTVMGFDPNNFTNSTMNDLYNNPNFAPDPNDPNGRKMWPFRPKINVINSPTTLGDPSPTADPGAPAFSIDKRIPPNVLYSNTCFIPGGLNNQNNSCPLIFTWYYNERQTSNPRNALMMSDFEIKMQPQNPPQGWRMRQDWTGGQAPVTGGSVDNAGKENSIENLKKQMIAAGIISPNATSSDPIPTGREPEASWYVQRKRSGDYLQIKTAYEFPAFAANYANDRSKFAMVLAPQNAIATATLGGSGNLKTQPQTRNTDWYRKRTYFVTGDWPAFAYATYNRINCILICKRKTCAGSTLPNTNLIFRNYFE